MNRWQKIAWFNLIVMINCFVVCFVLAAAISFRRAAIPPTPLSLVIIPSLILVAISTFIFRKKAKRVDFDERDRQIQRKSQYVGLWAFVISIVLAVTMEVTICFFAIGPAGTFRYPLVLLLTICTAGGVWIIANSIAVLVLYSSGGKNGEE